MLSICAFMCFFVAKPTFEAKAPIYICPWQKRKKFRTRKRRRIVLQGRYFLPYRRQMILFIALWSLIQTANTRAKKWRRKDSKQSGKLSKCPSRPRNRLQVNQNKKLRTPPNLTPLRPQFVETSLASTKPNSNTERPFTNDHHQEVFQIEEGCQ